MSLSSNIEKYKKKIRIIKKNIYEYEKDNKFY